MQCWKKRGAGEVLTRVSFPLHCHQSEKSSSCACTLHLAWSLTYPGLGWNNKPNSRQYRDTEPTHSHLLKWPLAHSHISGLIISTRWCETMGSMLILLWKLNSMNNRKYTHVTAVRHLIFFFFFCRLNYLTHSFGRWSYWLDTTNIPPVNLDYHYNIKYYHLWHECVGMKVISTISFQRLEQLENPLKFLSV